MHSTWFKDAPIKKKLTLLVLTAVSVALVLSSCVLLLQQWRVERNALVRQVSTLAEVLGANTSAALVFDDSQSANELLQSLRLTPVVKSARLLDSSGNLFAAYNDTGGEAERGPIDFSARAYVVDGLAIAHTPVISSGEVVGTLTLSASLQSIYGELVEYAIAATFVMAAAFLAAYFISARLQRGISEPILSLASTAERVTAEGNYSLRVEASSKDEIGVLYESFNGMLQQVQATELRLKEAHDELEVRVEERTRQLSDTNHELSNEVAERRRAEQELERMHREFLEAARHAGMAEVASNVLHNVGNVLNSVNVSASTIGQLIALPKRGQLAKITDLIDSHSEDLGAFFTQHEKGRQVPRLLKLLSEGLSSDDVKIVKETKSLVSHIEHIKAVIATQQSYASTSGLVAPVDVNELLEDAVRLNATSFDRHQITVERDLTELPEVITDKQRVLQIVINLVKNAKEALTDQHLQERKLTIRTAVEGEDLFIEVADTGIGIKPEDLSRIFSHGFSTKSDGHGFGLHSCANAANEMDGDLSAISDGPMRGAKFTLRLPYRTKTSPPKRARTTHPI